MEKNHSKIEKDLAKFEKDIKKVHRILCQFLPDRERAHQWLYLRNDKFLGRTPRDLVKEGRTGYVVKTILKSEEYRRFSALKLVEKNKGKSDGGEQVRGVCVRPESSDPVRESDSDDEPPKAA